MSTVYEALKKAALERVAQNSGRESTQPAPEEENEAVGSTFDATFHQTAGEELAVPIAEVTPPPDMVIGDAATSRISGEFQVLASHFRRLVTEQNCHVIEITSAQAGEGKSFITLNLGMSLARIGCRVTLVGADLRAPALHKAFNLTPLNGLLGYLAGRASFETCVYQTPIPGLTLIPSGGSSSAGGELFAGSRMREFIAAAIATDPNGYVLFDSPPLLAAPEAQIISRMIDGVLMVVAANQTARGTIRRALDLIRGCNILGLVLNRFEPAYSHRTHYQYS